uniref:C-type lectin domain-containing protein n=1 Tax=Salarias fasciatus TaxID=181472 RepID=A0A672HW76_SALFA
MRLLFICRTVTRASSQWDTERVSLSNSYNNLTAELNRLQNRYDNLTEDRDQLQKQLDEINVERNDLKAQLQGVIYSIFNNFNTEGTFINRADCLRRNADLLIINSKEEQVNLPQNLKEQVWIGLTDADAEGNWTCVDGTPFKESFSYWAAGEPNNATPRGEDCAEFKKYDSQFSWNDESCDRKKRWICEKKPTPCVG